MPRLGEATHQYTKKEEAKGILHSRRSLRPAVEAWWAENGWGSPPLAPVEDAGILARQIASFSFEDAAFTAACADAGLTPVWFEYTGDKMSSQSSYKLRLVQPVFAEKRGKKGGLLLRKHRLVKSVQRVDGLPLNAIRSDEGEPIVDFHRRQQDRCFPGAIRVDATDWLQSIGSARSYYTAFLAMAVSHVALFEDFHDPGDEDAGKTKFFIDEVFTPAFERVVEIFGVAPVIVQLPWYDEYRLFPDMADWQSLGVPLR